MDESKALLRNLILGTCHLCDRTRALARSETRDPLATLPVLEAAEMVRATLEALRAIWERECIPAPFPVEIPAEDSPADNWLLDGDFTDSPGQDS